MRIEAYIKNGNSFPIIVNHNEGVHLVKLRAGMSGKYGLLNEWIGNKLGCELGVKTQTPTWIELNDEIQTDDIYVEVRELIDKSFGLNIGFEYRLNAIDVSLNELNKYNELELTNIFLLDLILVNVDRTPNNINLMEVEGELFSIDYESSLLIQGIIEQRNIWDSGGVLQCLRNNPLYENVNEETVERFVEKSSVISIDKILSGIPESILTKEDYNLLLQGMIEKQKGGWSLEELIDKLKSIQPLTLEEQRERSKRNQAEFKRKIKENLAPK